MAPPVVARLKRQRQTTDGRLRRPWLGVVGQRADVAAIEELRIGTDGRAIEAVLNALLLLELVLQLLNDS